MSKLLDVLGTVYKIPMEDAEALKNSDGTFDEDKLSDLILQKDKDRIAEIKNQNKTRFDQGFQKAQKEVLSGFENKLKDKFEIESDLQGDELLDHVAEVAKSKSSEVKKLTDDDIKSHPLFMQTLKDHRRQLSEKDSEREGALKKMQDDFSQKEVLSKIEKAALDKFKKLGEPILPSDPEKASKMIQRLFLDELKNLSWMEKDGKFLPMDKEGKILQDEHGYAMELDDVVEKVAKSNIEFKTAKERQAPGNGQDLPPQKQQKEKKYTGKAPANKNEYVEMLSDDKLSSEQKMEIKAEYSAQFSKN